MVDDTPLYNLLISRLDFVIYTVVRENSLKCSPDHVKPLLQVFNDSPLPREKPQAPQTQRSRSCLIQVCLSMQSLITCCSLHRKPSLLILGNPLPSWRGHFLILQRPISSKVIMTKYYVTISHPR